jgi:hypothetical protein
VAQLGDIPTVIDRSELDSYERQTFIEEIIEEIIETQETRKPNKEIGKQKFRTLIESGSLVRRPQNKDSHEFSHYQGVFLL